MSKKARKLYQAVRRPLTAFLTLCLVLEMMPVQGLAFALEATAPEALEQVEPAASTQEVVADEAAAQEAQPTEQAEPVQEAAPAETPAPVAVTAVTEATTEVVEKVTEPVAQPEAPAEPAYPAFYGEVWTESTLVSVSAGEGVLPEGARLDLQWGIDPEPYKAAVDAATADDLSSAHVLRVVFYGADGAEVAPRGEVTVRVQGAEIDEADLHLYTMAADGSAAELAEWAVSYADSYTQEFRLTADEASRAFVIATTTAPVVDDEPAAEDAAPAEEVAPEEEAAPEEQPAEEVAPEEEVVPEEQPAEEVAPEEEVTPEEAAPEEQPAEEVVPEEEAPAEPAFPAQTITARAEDGMFVSIKADEGVLPEGATATASVVYATDALVEAIEGQLEDGKTVENVAAYDVTILDAEGNEIQPNGAVEVRFFGADVSGSDISVYHVEGAAEAPAAVSEVETSFATSAVQSFTTDGFSVYVVVNTGEDARLNVEFKNGTTTVATIPVKKGDVENGAVAASVLYDPSFDLNDGEVFKGWTTVQNYTADTTPVLSISDIRTDVAGMLPPASDGAIQTYYAMVFKQFKVTYLGEDRASLGQEIVEIPAYQSPASASYTINMSYTPNNPETHAFLGWNVSEGSSNISGYTDGKTYSVREVVTISGDVTFSAFVPEGHWLVFDENGKNATYNAPQFVIRDGVTSKPTPDSEMQRNGYTFGGWYTNADCTDGNEFIFGGTISDRTTIYAKWTPIATANYNVLIWQENLDSSGYDFVQSIQLTGNTNTTVSAVEKQGTGNGAYARIDGRDYNYDGFHLKGFDQEVKINPEGNSVVNVYYDRTEYTLTFQVRQNSVWNPGWRNAKTITAKYGTNISSYFPIEGYENYVWTSQNSQTFGNKMIVIADVMPAENITFRGRNSGTSFRMRYWVQPTNLSTNHADYELVNTITAYGRDVNLTYDEDFMELSGFVRESSTPSFDSAGEISHTGSGTMDVDFYYKRALYTLKFMDGAYVDGNGNPTGESEGLALGQVENIAYGSDMSSYNDYVPDKAPAGYVFAGWYLDDAGKSPYTFTTMPKGGITVYAKWVRTQYRVFLHPNADAVGNGLDWGSATQQMTFRVDYGGKVSAPTGRDTTNNYEFVGWYTDDACTQVFAPDMLLNESTVTTSYDKTNHFTDPMDKWGNGATTNADVDRPWIQKEFNLYGKWRAVLNGASGVQVKYVVGAGSDAPTDNNLYVDGATAFAFPACTAPAGKQFKNWVLQAWNGTEFVDKGVINPGDAFTVLASEAQATDIGEGKKTYTVQLRAEYTNAEDKIPTHIAWYSNYGTDHNGKGTLYRYDTKDSSGNDILGINEAVDIYAAPTREGYTFKGWTKTQGGTTADFLVYTGSSYTDANGNAATKVAADEWGEIEDLFAVWTANRDELNYDANDGTGDTMPATIGVVDGTVTVAKNTYTAPAGKKFDSWNTKIDGTGTKYAENDNYTLTIAEDILYAQWVPDPDQTYTVTYAATTGGSVDPASQTDQVLSSAKITGSTAAAAEGYKFEGWYKGEEKISEDLTLSAETAAANLNKTAAGNYDDTEYVAKFEVDDSQTYTVTYVSSDENMGAVDPDKNEDIQILGTEGVTGSKATANPGYEFIGWYNGEVLISEEAELTAEVAKNSLNRTEVGNYADTTYTARFAIDDDNTYRVQYMSENVNQGTVTSATEAEASIQVLTNEPVAGSTATAKPGYKFEGWYVANNKISSELVLTAEIAKANVQKDPATDVYADTTFIAKFEVDSDQTYDVTYKAVNGTVDTEENADIQVLGTEGVTGSKATATFGYKFDGWYKGSIAEENKIAGAEETLSAELAKSNLNKNANTGLYEDTKYIAYYVADFSDLEAVDYEGVYDAAGHNASITGNISGDIVTILDKDGNELSADYFVDVAYNEDGTVHANEVTVKVTRGNFVWTSDATVTIKPKTITVNDSASYVYNGEDQTLTIDGQKQVGVLQNETLMLEDATITGKLVGTYNELDGEYKWSVAKADGTDSTSNYTIVVTGTLTITDGTGPGEDPVPDELVVTKTDGSDKKYHMGDTVEWTVTATNIYDEAKTLTVTEAEGMTIVGEVPETLEAGQTVEIKVQHVVTAADVVAGSVKNEVTVKIGDLEKKGDDTVETDTIAVTVTAESASKVYDATELTKDAVTDGYKASLVAGDVLESVTVTGSQTLVGSSANVPSAAKFVNAKGEDVTAGYLITYANGMLTVTDGTKPGEDPVPDELVVTKADTKSGTAYKLGDTVTFNITATNIYAEAKTITLAEIEGVTLAQSTFENVEPGATVETTATYTITVKDVTAKSFTNTVTAKVGDVEKSATATVGVGTIAIEITAASDKKVYDATALTNDGYELTDGTLASGDVIDSVKVTGTQTLVGSSANVASEAVVKNAAGEDVTAGYAITYVDGTLTVTDGTNPGEDPVPDELVVTKTDGSDKKYHVGDTVEWTVTATNIYDEAKTLEVTEAEGMTIVGDVPETLEAGQTVEIKVQHVVTAADVVAGSVKNEVTVKIGDLEKKGDDTVETEKAELTITADSASKVYDGNPLTDDGWQDTAPTGLVNEHKVDSVKVTGTQTLVGSSANVASEAVVKNAAGEDVTAGYAITYVDGTLTVTDGTNPGEEPVDPSLVVTKSHEGDGFDLGEEVTFNITATNIYAEAKTITLAEIEGVTLAQSTFENVEPGATVETTATYTITEADILAGTFKNTVTATVGELVKTADDTVTPAEPNGHVTVTKTTTSTAPEGGYKLGDTVSYTITVKNDGNLTITDVTVTDERTGMSEKIASLALGASETFETSTTVTEADILSGHIVNEATATGTSPDPDVPDVPVTPGKTDDEPEAKNGHLTVTKVTTSTAAAEDGKYALGETISYKVTATNDGNLTLTNVKVTDDLTGDEWTVESLAPKASQDFETTYVVTEADVLAGEVLNVATATGTSSDPDEPDVPVTPGEDPEPTEDPKPSMTITKETTSTPANGETYALGETISYKVTATNDGNLTLTDVKVTDELTGDEWTVESLAPGASQDFETTYVVTEADVLAGSVVNEATATGVNPSDVPTDVTPGDTEDPTEDPNGHLTVTKETTTKPANGSTYALGEKIEYKVTVTNDGNLTITDVKVDDEMTNQHWLVKSLAPGKSETFTASHIVTEADVLAGQVVNVATAKGTSPDQDKPDVPVTPGIKVDPIDKPAPKIVSAKTSTGTMTGLDASGKPAYALGDELTYTISVTNEGNLTARGIEVVDAKLGYTADKPFVYEGEVKPGETVTVLTATYVVTEADVAAGSVLNEATVTATTDGGDPEPAPSKDEQPVEKIFTITYVPNGGNFNGSTENVVSHHKYGEVITIIGAPTRDGYTFLYWKGSEYQPGDKYTVVEDHTFVAQWEPKPEPAKPEPKKRVVRTGDDSLEPLYVTMAASGSALLALGALTLHRRRREDEDDVA